MADDGSLPEGQTKDAGKGGHESRDVRYLGMVADGDVVRLNPRRFDPVKRSDAVLEELILVARERSRLARRVLGKYRNNSVCVARGSDALCQSVDEPVDRGIAANSNRNGQDQNRRESRVAREGLG